MFIKFGDYSFSGPIPIGICSPPHKAGIYVILIPDSASKPLPYRAIYFGESENLSERGFSRSHHDYQNWLLKAGSENNLYIAVYQMHNSTPTQRREVEATLRAKYNVYQQKD